MTSQPNSFLKRVLQFFSGVVALLLWYSQDANAFTVYSDIWDLGSYNINDKINDVTITIQNRSSPLCAGGIVSVSSPFTLIDDKDNNKLKSSIGFDVGSYANTTFKLRPDTSVKGVSTTKLSFSYDTSLKPSDCYSYRDIYSNRTKSKDAGPIAITIKINTNTNSNIQNILNLILE